MEWIWPLAGIALSIAFGIGREAWLSRRRRAALGGQRTHETRAGLGKGESGPMVEGRLTLSAGTAVWRALYPPGRVDLRGATVLSTVAESRGREEGDIGLRLRAADGSQVRILLPLEDADVLRTVLAETSGEAPSPLPDEPEATPGRFARFRKAAAHRWPHALLVLTVLWFLVWGWLTVLDGRITTGEIVGGDGQGTCTVTWAQPDGSLGRSDIDCADEPPGAQRRIWVLGRPFTHEAVDYAWNNWSVGLVGAAVAIGGGGALVYRRLRSRRLTQADDVAPLASSGSPLTPAGSPVETGLPDLAAELEAGRRDGAADFLRRLVPYARRQLPGDGWQDPARPEGATPRIALRDAAASAVPVLIALAVVLGLTSPWPYRWFVLHTSTLATAPAVATGEEQIASWGPLPADDEVRFRLPDGSEATAGVTTGHDLEKGQQVSVRYAVDAPRWARLEGQDDELDLAFAVSLAGLLAVFGWGATNVYRVTRAVRVVRRTSAEGARPMNAVLFGDPDGDPALFVADPLVHPAKVYAAPVFPPLPHGAADYFRRVGVASVQVHGRLADERPVVVTLPELGGVRLLPFGPAWAVATDDLEFLLGPDGFLAVADDAAEAP